MECPAVYEVFDHFLDVETWTSGHDFDLARFYRALSKVVGEDGFSPDEMGRYMKGKKNPNYHDEIDQLVTKAWAVKDYLEATE